MLDHLVTLLPDAFMRWDDASRALLESTGHLEALRSHESKGTFPQSVMKSVSAFKLAASSVELGQDALAAAQKSIDTSLHAARSAVLAQLIALREKEVSTTKPLSDWTRFAPQLREEFLDELKPVCLAAEAALGTGASLARLPVLVDAALSDLSRAVSTKTLSYAIAAQKKAKARELRDKVAADARTAMDVDSLDATVSEVASSAGTHAAGKRYSALQKQVRRASLLLSLTTLDDLPDVPPPGRRASSPARQGYHLGVVVQAQGSGAAGRTSPTSQAQPGQQVAGQRQGRRPHRWEREEARSEGARLEARRREEAEEVAIDAALKLYASSSTNPSLRAIDVRFSGTLNLRKPESWPLDFFRLSRKEQPKFLLAHSKLLFAETLMAPPKLINPHGISVPSELERCLSMNVKFIPKPELDTVAPLLNWDKLERSVRLKHLFKDQKVDDSFDPRFYISNPEWKPPLAAPSIEYGLSIGRAALEQALEYAAEFKDSVKPNLSKRTLRTLQDFLSANDVLIKSADKNLGLVVLQRSWYVSEGLRQLSDLDTYRVVPPDEQEFLLADLIDERVTLLKEVTHYSPRASSLFTAKKGILKYLAAPALDEVIIPAFHHIPKVHKAPLKGRPIVPSHSWVTTNVSRYVDSLLQPIVRSCDWILRDTKQLIEQLASFELPRGEEIWLVTADIQSMYTNLPSDEGSRIMRWMGQNHFRDEGVGRLIGDLTRFVLTNNYLSFQGTLYHQLQGTAMGTPMAPTYANLFMAAYEREHDVENLANLLYYRRYIDDVFAIVRGPKCNAEEFIETLNGLHPKLKFDAELSQSMLPFLDVHLYLEGTATGPRPLTLHTKVYQKPLNAYQYIPWSSYHPETVKRSFIKGELTRYARISSTHRQYVEVAVKFWRRLRKRGYPIRWLRKAFSAVSYQGLRERFLARTARTGTTRSPLVYHVSYNPVWEYVNGSKLLTHTLKHWKPKHHRLTGTIKGNIIRAAHRPRNLGDLVNTWNKRRLSEGS